MQNDNLLDILNVSRDWNESHDITGMLLYIEGRFLTKIEGRFMQVLEGTEYEVNRIFDKIRLDERHHQVIVLKRQPIKQRHFQTWRMGFRSLNLIEYQNMPGFFELDDDFLSSHEFQQSDAPLSLLKSFYDINKQYDFL